MIAPKPNSYLKLDRQATNKIKDWSDTAAQRLASDFDTEDLL
jgi:hypothetical protein